MNRSILRLGVVARACISAIAMGAMAVVIARLPELLPGSSRRTELMFVVVFFFMIAGWSLVDAMIELTRARRRSSGRSSRGRFTRK